MSDAATPRPKSIPPKLGSASRFVRRLRLECERLVPAVVLVLVLVVFIAAGAVIVNSTLKSLRAMSTTAVAASEITGDTGPLIAGRRQPASMEGSG